MSNGLLTPCGDDIRVSCDYDCHKARDSTEPGTDYATSYGTPVHVADDGVIVDLKTSNDYATGRYITVDLDEGRRVRYLHLSTVDASVGRRVARGDVIAHTGASGFGSDWGYGPHVHVTLFPAHVYDFSHTVDFEDAVGDDEEDEMKSHYFHKHLELGSTGQQAIGAGDVAHLKLSGKGDTDTKLVQGPNVSVTAVLAITLNGVPTDPAVEAVQVEPVVSKRNSKNQLVDTSLGRQEVKGTPGLSRARVPIVCRLQDEDAYLRVKVFVPASAGSHVVVTEAGIRGVEVR